MPKQDPASPDIYPVLCYKDGRAAIDWLVTVLGFKSHFEAPTIHGGVGHAELTFGQGMVMLAGGQQPSVANPWTTARGGVYVVVDDVDAHHTQAKAAGAEIVMPPADTSHGSREYTVRDPDGHLWCFGTYRP